jgi:hypothetical protein
MAPMKLPRSPGADPDLPPRDPSELPEPLRSAVLRFRASVAGFRDVKATYDAWNERSAALVSKVIKTRRSVCDAYVEAHDAFYVYLGTLEDRSAALRRGDSERMEAIVLGLDPDTGEPDALPDFPDPAPEPFARFGRCIALPDTRKPDDRQEFEVEPGDGIDSTT